MGIGEK